jgi:hypothetical protein
MTDKYQKATLPNDYPTANKMAEEREEWARLARSYDQHGSAYELELTALLLREWAELLFCGTIRMENKTDDLSSKI